MGLRPWELPRYTPREFGNLVEGWTQQQDRERYRVAELATWLLAPHMAKGKSITPHDLLGTRPKGEDL